MTLKRFTSRSQDFSIKYFKYGIMVYRMEWKQYWADKRSMERISCSFREFNATLDCFCGRPIRALEIPASGPLITVIGGVRENPVVVPLKSAPFYGDLDPMYHIVPWAHPSPHSKRHLGSRDKLPVKTGNQFVKPWFRAKIKLF